MERAREYGYAKPSAPEEEKTAGRRVKDALLWLPRQLKPAPGLRHRLSLSMRIRGRALGIAAAAASARAMGRYDLGSRRITSSSSRRGARSGRTGGGCGRATSSRATCSSSRSSSCWSRFATKRRRWAFPS